MWGTTYSVDLFTMYYIHELTESLCEINALSRYICEDPNVRSCRYLALFWSLFVWRQMFRLSVVRCSVQLNKMCPLWLPYSLVLIWVFNKSVLPDYMTRFKPHFVGSLPPYLLLLIFHYVTNQTYHKIRVDFDSSKSVWYILWLINYCL